jgi:hypothetical protein
MDYYLGGYYLVEGLPRPPQMASFLPEVLWTVSACICNVYPDAWAFPWVNTDPDRQAEEQARLGLSDTDYGHMQAWVNTTFNEQRFGWPNVWLDLASARQYYHHYLRSIVGIKLLAIALPAPYLEDALAASAPKPGMGEDGVHQMLQLRRTLTEPEAEHARGFEVLGIDLGGTFHTFLCNYLEVPYRDELGLTFNHNGLLASLADAQRASEYTNLDSTAAEPVSWHPWLVVEYSLDE